MSQNVKDYLKNNTLIFNDSIVVTDINSLGFLNYQAYFFGEDHTTELGRYKENLVIDILQKKVKNIFTEYPTGYNYTVIEYLERSPMDTTTKDFEFYSGENKGQEILLRYIYNENQGKNDSLKLKLFHIDMIDVNKVNIDDMLWFFKKRIKPKPINKGFKYLKLIKTNNIRNEDSLIQQYILLKENFYNNLPAYRSYLKRHFIEMKNDIDGIYTYTLARKEDTSRCVCRSDSREKFMLKNIMDQIKDDSIKNFISINGISHIPLTVQYNFEYMNEWESLAAKFKKNNPDFDVCSIYFMDKNIDTFADKYFPSEKKLILDNIKEGRTYLIRLDGEDSPFKELSKKFQYIVVW